MRRPAVKLQNISGIVLVMGIIAAAIAIPAAASSDKAGTMRTTKAKPISVYKGTADTLKAVPLKPDDAKPLGRLRPAVVASVRARTVRVHGGHPGEATICTAPAHGPKHCSSSVGAISGHVCTKRRQGNKICAAATPAIPVCGGHAHAVHTEPAQPTHKGAENRRP